MPAGKTHDLITVALVFPVFAAGYAPSGDWRAGMVVAAAFLFAGLFFGPDLDTVSGQYSRWGLLRMIWLPYRRFFPHRSRLSHGLALGALIRVVYFLGSVTLIFLAGAYCYSTLVGGGRPGLAEIVGLWSPIGTTLKNTFGVNLFILVFAGLWAGAASHTLTDLAWTFITTGRRGKFF